MTQRNFRKEKKDNFIKIAKNNLQAHYKLLFTIENYSQLTIFPIDITEKHT